MIQPSEIRPLAIFMVLLLFPQLCWAYLDPSLGGPIYQLLLPVFAAIVAFWKTLKVLAVRSARWAYKKMLRS